MPVCWPRVTFLIGQWSEASMVMALYAIAEVSKARAMRHCAKHHQEFVGTVAPEEAKSTSQWLEWVRCGGEKMY